jgi:phage-related baseplate assembly protein
MWNLTPDYIQQVKEELKGRRAAIEARYADELKAIAADLDEIETLERIAYNFAVKHLPADPADEPPVELAALQPGPAEPIPEGEPAPRPR